MKYMPIFLGGLMKMCDNKAPIEIKSAWPSYVGYTPEVGSAEYGK